MYLAHLSEDGGGQSLQEHLLAVSALAEQRAARIGLGPAGGLIGLLHDLGKYSNDFQQYLKSIELNQDTEAAQPERGSVDHSTAGAQAIWRHLRGLGRLEGVVGEILSICVASHHSGLIDCVEPGGRPRLLDRMDKADSLSHHDEARANAEPEVVGRRERLLHNPEVVQGIRKTIESICHCDANETIRRCKVGLLTRFLFSCLIDADRTDTADSESSKAAAFRQHGRYVEWPILIERLERTLDAFTGSTPINELRQNVSDACLFAATRPKGIFTLTVPTGGGKTLASLRFGMHHAAKWGMERVIYVSPYTSIIDQNADVVRRILEPDGTEPSSIVLEHHSNLTPVKQTWRSKVLSENWDAPIVFTTAVQLLEALFGSGTRAVRRMHQMANTVLIFDEIQTLPVRCVHLFNNAINFLVEQCGSSIVLCTATQPLLQHVDAQKGAIRLLADAEIVPDVPKLFAAIQRHEILDRRKPGGWTHSEVAQLAIAETELAGSCLVVVNTKRDARLIFEACNASQRFPVVHLSTNMCPAHRLDILAEVKDRLKDRAPIICVSTQLIEAGVDISFAAAIRALAGLDSIAQTAGRCNRHGEAAIGRVHVVNLIGELPRALQEIRKAQEAGQRVLDENCGEKRTIDLSDPDLIEQYFRYYFFDRRQEMDYPVGPKLAERDDTLLNMLAENMLAVDVSKPPPIYLRQAFMTAGKAFQAIDADTRGIIVPYTSAGKAAISELCAVHQPKKQFALL